MSDLILAATLAYVWVSGGLFIAFLVSGEDWRTTSGKRISAFIMLWPLLTAWAAVTMVVEAAHKSIKRYAFKAPTASAAENSDE